MNTAAFDDIDALNALASDEFGAWDREVAITQELIDAFAALTGDDQWIHVDVARAQRESPYGTTIAQGFLTLTMLHQMGGYPLKVTGHSSATNYGGDRLRFLAPVPAGSRVHARGRVVGAETKGSGTLVTSEIEARVVGAEKPALLYRMQVLYR